MVGGKLLHGLLHPEFGHMRIPHDRDADPFPGACPYHGDCWEGLASGRAIEARWGRPASELADDDGLGARGEVPRARARLRHLRALARADRDRRRRDESARASWHSSAARSSADERLPRHAAVRDGIAGFITAPALGPRAGVLGAIALAESADLSGLIEEAGPSSNRRPSPGGCDRSACRPPAS